MLERLDRLVDEVGHLQSKLILLIGSPRSGKTCLLRSLGKHRQTAVLNVGASLGRQLLTVPHAHRHLKAAALLKDLADADARDNLAIFDNIELLFDRALRLNPLHLLKQHAHARRLVVAWPGELHNNRLTYAAIGHPEYQDYGINGLVPLEIR